MVCRICRVGRVLERFVAEGCSTVCEGFRGILIRNFSVYGGSENWYFPLSDNT